MAPDGELLVSSVDRFSQLPKVREHGMALLPVCDGRDHVRHVLS